MKPIKCSVSISLTIFILVDSTGTVLEARQENNYIGGVKPTETIKEIEEWEANWDDNSPLEVHFPDLGECKIYKKRI